MTNEDQGPTTKARGLGATARQRRVVIRAWQRWWRAYRADGSPALVLPSGAIVTLVCAEAIERGAVGL